MSTDCQFPSSIDFSCVNRSQEPKTQDSRPLNEYAVHYDWTCGVNPVRNTKQYYLDFICLLLVLIRRGEYRPGIICSVVCTMHMHGTHINTAYCDTFLSPGHHQFSNLPFDKHFKPCCSSIQHCVSIYHKYALPGQKKTLSFRVVFTLNWLEWARAWSWPGLAWHGLAWPESITH